MAETLVVFDTPVSDRNGRLYQPKACGRERDDGMWEGWLEFQDVQTGQVIRTSRETTQPNRTDIQYWATGLTSVYLEGALERTLAAPAPRRVEQAPPPAFDGPAGRLEARRHATTHDSILNPFSVYEKNPDLLAQELTALRSYHLRQIIRDYHLADEDEAPLEAMNEVELGALIMQRVRELHP
jgi:hypothetical protein